MSDILLYCMLFTFGINALFEIFLLSLPSSFLSAQVRLIDARTKNSRSNSVNEFLARGRALRAKASGGGC